MKTSNCRVCGLPREVCLHYVERKDDQSDRRVTRVLWFAIGFISAIISLILILKFDEKYI